MSSIENPILNLFREIKGSYGDLQKLHDVIHTRTKNIEAAVARLSGQKSQRLNPDSLLTENLLNYHILERTPETERPDIDIFNEIAIIRKTFRDYVTKNGFQSERIGQIAEEYENGLSNLQVRLLPEFIVSIQDRIEKLIQNNATTA